MVDMQLAILFSLFHFVSTVNNAGSGARLARDVLHELPGQVVEFMEKNKLRPPGPPPGYSE